MLGVVALCVFYSKVVDDESEPEIARVMFPKSRRDWNGMVSMWCQFALEEFVGKDAGLGKPYIPLRTSAQTNPLTAIAFRLYKSIMYCGMSFMGIRMYSYRSSGVPK